MKKILISMLLVGSMALGLASCGSKNNNGSGEASGNNKNYDIYVYNSKGENADAFKAMAEEYEKETGVKVKTFSIGSGQDHMETLRAQMNSSEQPSIFAIQGLKELPEWEESGKALDLSTVASGEFKDLVEGVDPSLRLSSDGKNSYGIPYNVEGYGYIVDKQMLTDIFPGVDIETLLKDIKNASYDEWKNFIVATDAYIKNNTAAGVVLSGNTYTMAAEKTGLATKLNGVFAVMGSQKWTYGDHMLNVALNAVFDSAQAANSATEEKIKELKPALVKYAQALDTKTTYLAGKDAPLVRGKEFIAESNTGYDQIAQIFAEGKALFLKQGNWAYANIEKVDKTVPERLTFVPVKMPFEQSDIKVDKTVEELNSSIPVFVPNFYAINASVSKDEQKKAMDFLVWLNTSEKGKKIVVEEFKFIPYNADASTVVNNSLGDSIIQYVKEGKTLAAPYHGAPASWSGDVVGLKVMEEYLTKKDWTEKEHQEIADYAVEQWIELIK